MNQMQADIARSISGMVLGQLQQCGTMGVVPLFTKTNGGPDYLTLSQALAQHQLTVTECSQGDSGPALNVINWASLPVLMIEGEELHAHAQSEAIDQSLLLQEQSETLFALSFPTTRRTARRGSNRRYELSQLASTHT